MSNPFKYFKDKKELWADWVRPLTWNKKPTEYLDEINAYNSRHHFPVSPEPDWEDGKIVYENVDFNIVEKCYKGTGFHDEWETIAIPLPNEPENDGQDVEQEAIAYADSIHLCDIDWNSEEEKQRYLKTHPRGLKDLYDCTIETFKAARNSQYDKYKPGRTYYGRPYQPPKPEQQDIPMEKDGWIKVKDKLPEPSKTKKWQIYSPSTLGVTDGFYWGEKADPCKGWSMMGVTHYKELPQSPKEEKES